MSHQIVQGVLNGVQLPDALAINRPLRSRFWFTSCCSPCSRLSGRCFGLAGGRLSCNRLAGRHCRFTGRGSGCSSGC